MERSRTTSAPWEGIEAIHLVTLHGTIRAAARAAGVAHTTLAARIRAAEAALGIVAFVRSPRGYVPTGDGRRVAAHAARMAREADALHRTAASGEGVAGSVRIAVLDVMLPVLVAPGLAAIASRHEGLRFELSVNTDLADLDRQEADIALRIQREPAADLVGRRIGPIGMAPYGTSPTLPDGGPVPVVAWGSGPAALRSLAPLGRNLSVRWTVRGIEAQRAVVLGTGAVGELPCFAADPDPRLHRLTEAPTREIRDLWLLTHPDLRRLPRIRAVMEELGDALAAARPRLAGRA